MICARKEVGAADSNRVEYIYIEILLLPPTAQINQTVWIGGAKGPTSLKPPAGPPHLGASRYERVFGLLVCLSCPRPSPCVASCRLVPATCARCCTDSVCCVAGSGVDGGVDVTRHRPPTTVPPYHRTADTATHHHTQTQVPRARAHVRTPHQPKLPTAHCPLPTAHCRWRHQRWPQLCSSMQCGCPR